MELVGKLLGNRYEVLEKIGDGGMATVYKAKDKILNRKVAIKVLKDEYSNDQEFIKRFQIEAQSAASLSHPNIVSIFDVSNENNIHYIVMELIEGKTLKEKIVEEGKLNWKEAVEIASQIASGLAQAHKNHIIHRDIKPHNIIIPRDGVAKITDFGIAKAVTSSTINASGSTLGSVHYFSPEHARGGYTDEKSDIYSLGVVLYEMVTGKLPFEADTPVSVALKHLQEEPVPPMDIASDIPIGLNDIILKAMKKDISERYSSAQEMYKDLQRILKTPNATDVGINSTDMENFATQRIPVIGIGNRDNDSYTNNKYTREKTTGDTENAEDDYKPYERLSSYSKKVAESNKASNGNTKNTNIEDKVDREYMGRPKKKKVTKMQALVKLLIFIILAIGLVSLSAFATTKILEGINSDENIRYVPELKGLSKEEAESKLAEQGLKMEVQANVTSEFPKDYVVSQEYEEGYEVKAGATVGVTLSKGARTVLVPDVTSMSAEAAKIEIEKNNLVFEMKEEGSNLVPEGEIIRQDPIFNTEVGEGETVTIYVSTGMPDGMVEVPDVTKYNELQAKDVLNTMNLIPVVTYATDYKEEEGKILGQTPVGGEFVSELTEVTIIINKYDTSDEPTKPDDNKPDDNKPDNNKPDNNQNNKDDQTYITINLSNKGTRDTFTVRVELQGDITGKRILHEGTHSRSEGSFKVAIPKDATGLLRVYIDDEVDSEQIL